MNNQSKTAIFVSLTVIGFMMVLFKFSEPQKKDMSKDITSDVNTNTTTDVADFTVDINTGKLETVTLVEGSGDVAKEGDTVSVYYTGRFIDGSEFDSSDAHQPKTPFEFTLGAGMVIKGWDLGVEGMKAGETRQMSIPSDLAYGPNDYNGIPGGSTLVFDVELLEIK